MNPSSGELRMLDARTGSAVEVRPARPGLLRVCAHARPESEKSGLNGVRVLLLADLLARSAELIGIQVFTAVVFPCAVPAELTCAERAASELGVHPPAVRTGVGADGALPAGWADVRIIDDAASPKVSGGEIVTRAGSVRWRGSADGDRLPEMTPFTRDAAAVRLALMSAPYGDAVDLNDVDFVSACETVTRWRRLVGLWAESPSKPIPEGIARQIGSAFRDLDMVPVLALLRDLASDEAIAPGAKFETIVFADRVLGLDLAREIGQPHSGSES